VIFNDLSVRILTNNRSLIQREPDLCGLQDLTLQNPSFSRRIRTIANLGRLKIFLWGNSDDDKQHRAGIFLGANALEPVLTG
jgi:hypothetical protein